MKTYKKTIEVKMLEIWNDDFCESPRTDTNSGYFITVDSSYSSPDKNETLERIIKQTAEEADNREDHRNKIIERIQEETGEKVIALYDIYKHQHSNIVYRRGLSRGFDYSNNGFYIVTDETQKATGIKKEDLEKSIDQELEMYSAWVNGEVYQYCLYDEQGNEIDRCSGFYSLDDIKSELPEDWQDEDMQDYLTYK